MRMLLHTVTVGRERPKIKEREEIIHEAGHDNRMHDNISASAILLSLEDRHA